MAHRLFIEGDNPICPYCTTVNNGSDLNWAWQWMSCIGCGRNFMARTNETGLVQSKSEAK